MRLSAGREKAARDIHGRDYILRYFSVQPQAIVLGRIKRFDLAITSRYYGPRALLFGSTMHDVVSQGVRIRQWATMGRNHCAQSVHLACVLATCGGCMDAPGHYGYDEPAPHLGGHCLCRAHDARKRRRGAYAVSAKLLDVPLYLSVERFER